MVLEVGAFEAKTRLSSLLERVRQGDRVVITRCGVPVAVLVPPGESDRGRTADVIRKLAQVRRRTRARPGTLRTLRDEGRRR